MFTILSWNIQQGGGNRVNKIIENLTLQAPEVIVLSEFKNNDKGQLIRNKLLSAKYRFQGITPAKSANNSVLIASKVAANFTWFSGIDDEYSHNILEADFGAFVLYGVYLPHKKKHTLFDFFQQKVKNSKKPIIIAGDFNTGINYVDQKGNSFWYEADLKELQSLGMLDAYRFIHGDKKEYSWFSHQGNGYRYDHTYVSESIKNIIHSCDYLHDWRENKLADHSPMILELKT